jgi:exodeoxyribonuclease-5
MGIEMNDDQIFATMKLEHWWKTRDDQVFEIAGGAGTGKTTCILYFIQRIGLELEDVLFVSYMGKAVSQMIRNGLPAKTIHSTCYTYSKEVERDEKGHIVYTETGKPKMTWVATLKNHIPKNIKLIVVDEAFTIPERNALDLLTFGLPIVALGDDNQLPPPFGRPYFLSKPNVKLYQIMRQAEGNPIIYLAQQILDEGYIKEGVYGTSAVIRKKNLTDYTLKHADIIITGTNSLRSEINRLFREHFLDFTDLEVPHYGEKIICRRNNWGKYMKGNGGVYLTNGTTGFVDYVEKGSYTSKSIKIDFRPDFADHSFHNLKIDLERLNLRPGSKVDAHYMPDTDIFEYAYALTGFSCQGSQWNNVTILQEEDFFHNERNYRRLLYSEITRAIDSVTFVLQ